MQGKEVKTAILGEIGLVDGLEGSILCEEIRINAANMLPRACAKHTMAGDEIAYTMYANGLFLFAIDVATYGDIGVTDCENTREVISEILDLLIELYDNRDNKYRARRCNALLYELCNRFTLFQAPILTRQRELCTI
jgi:hypothetical protein